VYAFFPQRYAHRGQLKLLSNQWIPLVAFYLIRLTQRSRLRDGLGVGVALALCGLCGWHQLFLAGTWVAIWLLHSLATERGRWTWKTVQHLVLGGLICVVVVAPLLTPMVKELVNTPRAELKPSAGPYGKSTDLLAFFVPPAEHLVFQIEAASRFYERLVRFGGPAAAVGWLPFLLAGWAVYSDRKSALPWCISAVLLAVLALGPRLHINGQSLPIPLPYAILEPTFLATFLRHPNRFNIVLGVPVSVLVALGWQAARSRWTLLRWGGSWSTVTVFF
jgi:hypothetical protein